jgi:hypothetical protein
MSNLTIIGVGDGKENNKKLKGSNLKFSHVCFEKDIVFPGILQNFELNYFGVFLSYSIQTVYQHHLVVVQSAEY